MTSDVITLVDGRRLSWHEFGDPNGWPVVYTAGTPVGMTTSARVMNWLARNAPALNTIRVAAMRRELVGADSRERSLHRATAAASDAAHAAALRIESEAVADALRPGSRATVQELALIKRPWTFPLSEVKTPVHLRHGALDRNAPVAFARRLAYELPDATLHISDSSGHDVGLDRAGEVMAVLASYAS